MSDPSSFPPSRDSAVFDTAEDDEDDGAAQPAADEEDQNDIDATLAQFEQDEEEQEAEDETGEADAVDAPGDGEDGPLEHIPSAGATAEVIEKIQSTIRNLFESEDASSISKKLVKQRLIEEHGEEFVHEYRSEYLEILKEEITKRVESMVNQEYQNDQPEQEQGADYLDQEGSEEEDDYEPDEEEEDGDADGGDDDYAPNKAQSKKRARKGGEEDSDGGERGSKKKKKKSKKLKRGIEPDRPKNAYIHYFQENRAAFAAEHPSLNRNDLTKQLSEQWKSLPEDDKQKYHDLAIADKRRYERELEEFKENYPEEYEKLHGEGKKSKKNTEGKKKKRKSEAGSGSEDEDGPVVKKELSHIDSVIESLKSKRQNKSELDAEAQQKLDALFLISMDNAAKEDEYAMREERPAIAKLKMLPKVQETLSKKHVSLRLLDDAFSEEHGKVPPLLSIIRRWLQLLPGNHLPNIQIRSVLYRVLDSLPVGESHLERSNGLGKVVMKLWRHPKESDENKKILGAMIERWMRLVSKVRTNYKELADVEEDDRRKAEIADRAAALELKRPMPRLQTSRAAIPEPANFDYAVRPPSQVEIDSEEEEDMIKKDQDLTRKQRMNKKLDKMKKSAGAGTKARYRVDVSGGKTNLT